MPRSKRMAFAFLRPIAAETSRTTGHDRSSATRLLHLPPGRQDVRKYVRSIEEVVIRTLREFSINAARIEKWPGVWVEQSRHGGPRKICAIGVHLSRWYTKHGFALNVEPNLSHFELIVPCGIKEAGVTSMAVENWGRAGHRLRA